MFHYLTSEHHYLGHHHYSFPHYSTITNTHTLATISDHQHFPTWPHFLLTKCSPGEILNLARSKFYTWRHRWHSAVDRWAGVLGLNVSVAIARVENWYWYSLSNLEGPPPPLLKTCLDKGHNNIYLTVTNHGTIGLAKKWSSEQTKLSCKLVLTSYCHYDNF